MTSNLLHRKNIPGELKICNIYVCVNFIILQIEEHAVEQIYKKLNFERPDSRETVDHGPGFLRKRGS